MNSQHQFVSPEQFKILIVEDDVNNLATLERIIKRKKFQTAIAENGE